MYIMAPVSLTTATFTHMKAAEKLNTYYGVVTSQGGKGYERCNSSSPPPPPNQKYFGCVTTRICYTHLEEIKKKIVSDFVYYLSIKVCNHELS